MLIQLFRFVFKFLLNCGGGGGVGSSLIRRGMLFHAFAGHCKKYNTNYAANIYNQQKVSKLQVEPYGTSNQKLLAIAKTLHIFSRAIYVMVK